MDIKKIFLPIFLSTGTIFAFILSFKKTDTNTAINSDSFHNSKSSQSGPKKVDDTVLAPQQFQKLSVLPLRCIGCGKCARIDSSHFEMSYSTGKAIVISSTNLNSQSLTLAINNCPVQAITLN